MARLIPKIQPDAIENSGERDVAIALAAQLPDDCAVYHSYPWVRANRDARGDRTYLEEGEMDFVVVDPSLGVLVLEVARLPAPWCPDVRVDVAVPTCRR